MFDFDLQVWAKRTAGMIFWGWLALRLLNDWFGGVFVPQGQPFIPSNAVSFFQPLAFAVKYLPELASGVWLSIVLIVISITLGFPIAVVLASARVYGRVSGWISLGYTELIRGTPLLAQLFVLYYGLSLTSFIRTLPFVGHGVVPAQAFWVAIIGFTVNSSAYQAEYLRGAIQSVDREQLQAARAIGLSQTRSIQFVVLPQALRYAIPSWMNELVYLIKYSSLASFITVPELFNSIDSIASETFTYLPLYTLAALIYLALVLTATNLMEDLEQRVAIPGLGGEHNR